MVDETGGGRGDHPRFACEENRVAHLGNGHVAPQNGGAGKALYGGAGSKGGGGKESLVRSGDGGYAAGEGVRRSSQR